MILKSLVLAACIFIGGNSFSGEQEIAMDEPFWQGNTVYGESLLFIKAGDSPASSTCLFRPEKIIQLKSTFKGIVYTPGKDYILKPGSREIYLPPGSRINFITADSLFPPAGAKNSINYKKDDKARGVLYYRLTGFPEIQTEITYEHADKWDGVIPEFAGDKLPGFYGKLEKRETVRVTILGDSITAGYNASKIIKIPPYQPDWKMLWVTAMMKAFRTSVVSNEKAAPGRTIGWMLLNLGKQLDTHPDLVVIAFGMNDYNAYKDAKLFKQKLNEMILKFRGKYPECEFLLISPMLGNPEWSNTLWTWAFSYLKAMKELEAPGVVVADLTSLWRDMLKNKSYVSQTGNGVNHPNDFGHRVYAQYLLSMFIRKNKGNK